MLQRFRNGWSLVKASGNVLMQDKELLIFPVLSGLAVVLVTASFFGVGVLTGLARVTSSFVRAFADAPPEYRSIENAQQATAIAMRARAS